MKLLTYLALPVAISDFERAYLTRMNRIGLVFFALHVPVLTLLAWALHTGPLAAAALSLGAFAGPLIAYVALKNPRAVSVTYGVAAMFTGGILVHVGQGSMQIEMHFYFFALIAMLAMYGNPLVIVAAAATVTLHHLGLWFLLPPSVFNYDAPVWVVAVHMLFVVLESVGSCFIARSFFDNVIGLEAIVQARTADLERRNHDVRLLLDSVDQGFLMLDLGAVVSSEWSAVLGRWFGAPGAGATLFDYMATFSEDFAERSRVAWEQVADGFLTHELSLDQMPRELAVGEHHYRFEYSAVGISASPERFLCVISDVSSAALHERADRKRRESMQIYERLLSDRNGFRDFFEEASNLVDAVTHGDEAALGNRRRVLHTLKGNCAIFGLESVASLCHRMETQLFEEGALRPEVVAELTSRWAELSAEVEKLIGLRSRFIEVDPAQHGALEHAVRAGARPEVLIRLVQDLKLEPTRRRLAHFAEQARRIARRLDKGEIHVHIEDSGLRIESGRWSKFWNAFIHAVRNAVDHGLEEPERRSAAGKPERGRIVLRTYLTEGRLAIEIQDDGRGIDWQRVAEKGSRLGVPTATPSELVAAVFVDGVTTATRVSEFSGRGVGLGALLAATEALDGRIEIVSQAGTGTTLTMLFPGAALQPSPADREHTVTTKIKAAAPAAQRN